MHADGSSKMVLLDLPGDVLSTLRRSPDQFARELRLAAALHMYERGELSRHEAAQIADLDPEVFARAVRLDTTETFEVDLGSD